LSPYDKQTWKTLPDGGDGRVASPDRLQVCALCRPVPDRRIGRQAAKADARLRGYNGLRSQVQRTGRPDDAADYERECKDRDYECVHG
jgi:hypothetical protein